MTAKPSLELVADLLTDGNRSELARLLGVHRSTVAGWENPERRAFGMCGYIPERYIPTVLRLLRERGSEIDPRCLYPLDTSCKEA